MPPVYEALLLNTVVPQIQAAQAGDSYVMVVNATTPALRITQTGTGDAILVEDAANPDSSPFVVTAGGDVGIGTNAPGAKLDVNGSALLKVASGNAGYGWLSGTTNYSLYLNAADNSLRLYSSVGVAGDKLIIDSSGNLGLGVTPSAWSQGRGFELLAPGMGLWNGSGSPSSIYITGNAYFNSGFKYGVNGEASHYYQYLGQHVWSTAPSGTAGNAISFTQAMTLDASGNLLVGTTTSSNRTITVGATNASIALADANGGIYFGATGTPVGSGGFGVNAAIARAGGTNFHISGSVAGDLCIAPEGTKAILFGTSASASSVTERARITSGGDLLVGTQTAGAGIAGVNSRVAVVAAASSFGGVFVTDATAYHDLLLWNKATTGNNAFVEFATEASYTGRGSITYNRAGGLVAYNTTSDYRAKDILGPVADSGTTIDALKVYNGKMKGATVERPMLIAHEAQEVTPYAVTGEKDAVNDDGTPKYQQMDVSSLVPLLIAELQSLRARVAQLEAK